MIGAPAASEPHGRSGFFANSWYIVGLLACLGLVSIIDRTALNLLIEPLKADLGISDTQAGLLMGPTFALVYTMSALPIAWALDRRNRKWITIGGVAIWSLCTSASAFAVNFEWLFILRMGVGVGEAVLNPVAVSLIGDLFVRERRATPASVFMSAQVLGGAISFLLIAAILAAWSSGVPGVSNHIPDTAPWRVALFLIGLPGLVLAAIMAITLREPERGRFDQADSGEVDGKSNRSFATKRDTARFYVPFLLGINLIGMMQNVSASWFPTFLIRTHNAPIADVGFLFGSALLVASLGTLAGPMIAERFALRGRKDAAFLVVFVSIPAAALCMMAALTVDGLWHATVFAAMAHVFTNSITVMPSVVISSIGSSNSRARLISAHLFVQAIFAYTVGPVMVPVLADALFHGQLGPSIMTLLVIACPLSIALLLAGWGPYKRAVRA